MFGASPTQPGGLESRAVSMGFTETRGAGVCVLRRGPGPRVAYRLHFGPVELGSKQLKHRTTGQLSNSARRCIDVGL